MKRNIVIVFLIAMLMLSGCKMEKDIVSTEYFGDFENEPVFQKIVKIEKCIEPEQLVVLLEEVYGETITYLSLEYDEESKAFKSPYEDFEFYVLSVYSPSKNKGKVSSNVVAFFMEYHEAPIFIMDNEGSYLVSNYEVVDAGEDKYLHKVDAWVLADLYLCLHEYAQCDGDAMRRKAYSNIVKSMTKYMHFEKQIADKVS